MSAIRKLPALPAVEWTQKWTQTTVSACQKVSRTDTSNVDTPPIVLKSKSLAEQNLDQPVIICFDISQTTPGRNRTCNLRIRSPLLYPVELRARDVFRPVHFTSRNSDRYGYSADP